MTIGCRCDAPAADAVPSDGGGRQVVDPESPIRDVIHTKFTPIVMRTYNYDKVSERASAFRRGKKAN